MDTVYHLALVHEPTARILAIPTPAGWLLPTRLVRGGVPMARLFEPLAHLAPAGRARCVVRPELDPLTGSANQTLVIDLASDDCRIDTGAGALGAAAAATFVDFHNLPSAPALVPYQARAVRWLASLSTQARRPAPLAPNWLHDVAEWVEPIVETAASRLRQTAQILRADEDSVVVRFRGDGEICYFKGRTRPPFVEAAANRVIAARLPHLVPAVRALDLERGWQLTAHVDGVALDAGRWPAHLVAADDWLRLQRALEPRSAALRSQGVPEIAAPDMRAAAADAIDTLSADARPDGSAVDLFERVEGILASPLLAELPPLLLHFDAAPRNLLWNGRHAVFLDLDSLHLGPAVAAGSLMARRMKGELGSESRRRLAAHAAHALLHAVDRRDLAAHLAPVDAIADLCLLTMRHRALRAADPAPIGAHARAWTWRRNALDFVARVAAWPPDVQFPHRWRP